MTTFALNNLWAYLQGLSLSQSDREWLAKKLIMPNETHLIEDDNARLDDALAKFSGDFGGSADAMTVAKERTHDTYLLDTCICIALLKKNPDVIQHLREIGTHNCKISDITLVQCKNKQNTS